MKSISTALFAAALSISGAAFAHGDEDHAAMGRPGVASKVDRTVTVTMSDAMQFSPASIAVKRGETIRFVLKNEGKARHELVLGTIHELKEHAALMRKFPTMEHADPNHASVEPGQTGALIWQFTKPGTFDFACLQPGHFEAGMKGQVIVSGRAVLPVAQGETTHSVADGLRLAQASDAEMTEGVVRKVDKAAGKITLKHGEIKNLDMPGMTMVFRVQDPAMLDMVKPGDKVWFRAEKSDGALIVTQIQPAP